MDPIQFARIHRAQDQIRTALADSANHEKAAAFIDLAFETLRHDQPAARRSALANHENDIVRKAAAHSTLDDVWEGNIAALAAAYLKTISEFSLLDALSKYAVRLTATHGRVLVASDAVGDVVSEGAPKPVKRLSLNLADVEPRKSCGIAVLSKELVQAGGAAVRVLFERELQSAVTRATNSGVLSAVGKNADVVQGTGDPLSDLRTGLQATGASSGFVIGAPAGDVAALALEAAALPGFGVRGGEFRPGIHVVAIDDAKDIIIIPASRAALWDCGLQVRSAAHATVDLRDNPQAPAERVSLWQNYLLGLLCERSWHIAQAPGVVRVER